MVYVEKTSGIGWQSWQENRLPDVAYASYYACGDICTAQTAGAWGFEKNQLNLKLCYLNGPLGVTASFTFSENTLQVKVHKNRSMALKTDFIFSVKH